MTLPYPHCVSWRLPSWSSILLPCLVSATLACSSYAIGWGVAGHKQSSGYPVYQNISASQQLDCVNALGLTYYRVDASSATDVKALVDLIRNNSAYSRIRIIPILNAFTSDDIINNPTGYTDTQFYNTSKTTAQNWVNYWATNGYTPFPFEAVEISNELDNNCINSGAAGSSSTDYNTTKFNHCKAIIQGLCDGVRAANATVPRMVGCAGWLHYGFTDRLISDLGAPDWEINVYHWYSNMGLISSHSDVTAKLQSYVTSYNMPTWVTEVDCRDGSLPQTGETTAQAEARHGATLSDLIQDMKQFSFIHRICVYELLDEGNRGSTNGEAHYGIYHTSLSGGVYQLGTEKTAVISAYRASMHIDSGTTYELEPRNALGKRLNITGASGANNANVEIYADNNTAPERWTATYMGSAGFEFTPTNATTMRLDVDGAGSAPGTNVKIYTDNDSGAQIWRPYGNSDASFSFEPECASGLRLDVASGGTANGTNVDISTANGATYQNWGLYNLSTRTLETESLVAQSISSGDTHRIFLDTAMSASQGSILDANAVGDYVGYVVPDVSAGTYDVRVGVKKLNTRGIIQLAIGRADSFDSTNGNVGATQDLYSASPVYTELDLGNWTAGTSSDKEFRFKVTGKNASSTGYTMAFDYIKLIPQ